MPPPFDVVSHAARLARKLADQARRVGEPDHAAYFDRMAAEADARAALLLDVEASQKTVGRQGETGMDQRKAAHCPICRSVTPHEAVSSVARGQDFWRCCVCGTVHHTPRPS